MLFRGFYFAVAFLLATTCQAAESLGIATVVDGDAILIRQTTKQILVAGARLRASDFIETGPTTGIVRVEFANGVLADMGPGTKVMVAPTLANPGSKDTLIYALTGWVKISVAGKATQFPAPSSLLTADTLGLSDVNGSAVVVVAGSDSSAFCETGTLIVHERRKGKLLPAVALKSGAFFSTSGKSKPTVSAKPPETFVKGVPKAFLDPIPLRANLYESKAEPKPRYIGELSYADAAPWLAAETAIKGALVARWRSELSPNLRSGLVANIKSHPEWDRTLFPEKYLPKPPASTPVKLR